MPDLGTAVPRPSPPSHTATQQWQSFEIKMRYRRAERCVARAEAALAAGRDDEARSALAEARTLNSQTPSFDEMLTAFRAREAAAAAANRTRRQRTAMAAAALVVTVGAAGFGWWLQRPGDDTQQNAAVPPSSPTVSVPSVTAPSPEPPAPANELAPVQMATQPATPPVVESPVRTSGSASETVDAPAAVPDPAPMRRDEPALPPVQSVSPSLVLKGPTTAEATETGITRVNGPGGLVGSLPSAAIPVVTTPPPVPPVLTAKPVEPPVESEEPKVRAVLAQFEAAYSNLSASAAQAVWPSVDARALARAFDSLQSQHVSLGRCSIEIQGQSARADCSGTASWTPRVGGGRRTQPRRWEIDLAVENGVWHIARASVR